jgi:hypothetical protein
MSATVTAGAVMDRAAAYMNDAAKSIYTYTVQIPYLNSAIQSLQEYYELHGISTTQKTSALINVTSGTTTIGFATTPALPSDLIEPVEVWEKREGTNGYVLVDKRNFMPGSLDGIQTSYFGIYTWNGQELKFPSATQDIDIKIDYIREMFTQVTSDANILTLVNARSFLEFKTAANLAKFVAENPTRAMELEREAEIARDLSSGIAIKGKQNIATRRRPFMGGRRYYR